MVEVRPDLPTNHNLKPRGLRLLSLDGGGVRGYSSLLILQRLMYQIDADNPPRPCEVFDMIGGTSTGGLIAIMLGRLGMAVDECIYAYIDLSKYVFDEPRWPVDLKLRVKPRHDSKKLEDAIKHIVFHATEDENALMTKEANPSCKVFVCATRGDSSKTAHLRNYISRHDASDLNYVKIWQAGRATSAAPSYFDPIAIGKHENMFFDGGAGCNNPIEEVFAAAMDVWSPQDPTYLKQSIECMISIGTGVPKGGRFGSDWPSLFLALSNIALDTEATAQRFAKAHPDLGKTALEQSKYIRFNVAGGLGEVGLGAHQKMGEIYTKTIEYLDTQTVRNEIEIFAAKLRIEDERKPAQATKTSIPPLRRPRRRWSPLRLFGSFYTLYAIIILLLLIHKFYPKRKPEVDPYWWLDPKVPVFAIIGKTGVGKSTFISTLGGRHVQNGEIPIVGHNLESCTENLTWYEANVTNYETEKIYVIDTPGFDDSRYSDKDILKMITLGLADVYKRGDKLMKGVIFMHDISQPRIGGLGKEIINALQKLVGYENLQNVALVTSKWIKNPDPEEAKRQIERYKELQDIYWADMIDAGSLVMQHSGTRASAHLIVSTLLLKDDILLRALREIVLEDKEWEDTEAGQAANDKRGFWDYFPGGNAENGNKNEEPTSKKNTKYQPPKGKKRPESQGDDETRKTTRRKTETSTARPQEKSNDYKTVLKPRQPLSHKTAPKREPEKQKPKSEEDSLGAVIGLMVVVFAISAYCFGPVPAMAITGMVLFVLFLIVLG